MHVFTKITQQIMTWALKNNKLISNIQILEANYDGNFQNEQQN